MIKPETAEEAKLIAVTGAPCAGKSSLLKAILDHYPEQVLFAPEVATILMAGGYPAPGRDVEYSEEWQYHFETAVLSVQQSLEAAYRMMARAKGARLIVCDRGVLDGAAYCGGLEAFCARYGIDRHKELERYHAVIHLETLAVSKPHLYSKNGNEVRYESPEKAIEIDRSLRDAWAGHRRHVLIEGPRTLEEQNRIVLEVLQEILSAAAHA